MIYVRKEEFVVGRMYRCMHMAGAYVWFDGTNIWLQQFDNAPFVINPSPGSLFIQHEPEHKSAKVSMNPSLPEVLLLVVWMFVMTAI